MIAFVVTAPVDQVEVASDVLWQLGVRAIEERTIESDRRLIELWTAVGDDPASVDRAAQQIGQRWPWRTVSVNDPVSEAWRHFARPMWVDDGLVVVPAWQDHAVGVDVLAVAIEPGGAFGLGDHPTTLLSLQAVRRIGPRLDTRRVLDVGCGTGVVAIVAALLGAAEVRAVDIASAAVEATADNAARNGVRERVVVDTTPAAELEGSFDLVVANILAPTLIRLAADLRRLTRPGGHLVISGILADAHAHVLEALEPMVVQRTDSLDGWAAVTLGHPRR